MLGFVNQSCEAIIRVAVGHANLPKQIVEAVIGTGFTGFLSLPPSYVRERGSHRTSVGGGNATRYCFVPRNAPRFIWRYVRIEIKQVNCIDPTCGLRESHALEDIDPLWVESRNHRLEMSNRLTVGYPANTAEKLENLRLFRAESVNLNHYRSRITLVFS